MRKISALLLLPILLFVASCDEVVVVPTLETPATYSFERDGQTSVSYGGQIDRLNQLGQMKSLMSAANGGSQIDGQDLLDMYANKDENGGGNFDFTTTKQLKNKTFASDQTYFDGLLSAMGNASVNGANGDTAIAGSVGLLWRGGNASKSILVNEKGHEFTQIIEKGIMGAVFYYQTLETYMSDARVGDDVENTTLNNGKNYTAMEHHWDEAFGYLGLPVDFKSNWPSDRNGEATFWGNYIRGRDALLGSSDKIMNAFKLGRAAIVAKEYTVKNAQRDIIYAEFERVCAATAIHYINAALAASDDDGERMHVMSEAYAFIRALQFSPKQSFTNAEVGQLLKDISDNDLNFWNTTANGLNSAKNTLSSKFALDSVKNDL